MFDDRKIEPFVPPAFINVRCAENVSLSHSVVVGMRAKARLLCKSNQVALPRIGIPTCVQAPWRRAAARNRALAAARASKPREAGNTWTFYPLPFHTARIRDAPDSDAVRIKSPPEPTVPALRDAFVNGREWAGERRKAAGGTEADSPSATTFQAGADWV